jgi:hypothetical protein
MAQSSREQRWCSTPLLGFSSPTEAESQSEQSSELSAVPRQAYDYLLSNNPLQLRDGNLKSGCAGYSENMLSRVAHGKTGDFGNRLFHVHLGGRRASRLEAGLRSPEDSPDPTEGVGNENGDLGLLAS